MQNRAITPKNSDFILGTLALIVVGGLCLKGAHALYGETQSNKKMTTVIQFAQFKKK